MSSLLGALVRKKYVPGIYGFMKSELKKKVQKEHLTTMVERPEEQQQANTSMSVFEKFFARADPYYRLESEDTKKRYERNLAYLQIMEHSRFL